MERKTTIFVILVLVIGIAVGYILGTRPGTPTIPDSSTVIENIIKNPIEIITCIVVLIGVILGWRELRSLAFARYSELLRQLHLIWNSQNIVESRKALQKASRTGKSLAQVIEKNPDKRFVIIRALNFLEHVGVLVNKKLLSLDLTMAVLTTPIVRSYELSKDYVKYVREKYKQPTAYENFEKLVEKVIEEAKKRKMTLYKSWEELERLTKN